MSFIIRMLSGERGPSSKRGVMVFLLLLFAFLVVTDTFTGKHPQEMYSQQVFELLVVSLSLVFGEKVLKIWDKKPPTIPPPPDEK